MASSVETYTRELFGCPGPRINEYHMTLFATFYIVPLLLINSFRSRDNILEKRKVRLNRSMVHPR